MPEFDGIISHNKRRKSARIVSIKLALKIKSLMCGILQEREKLICYPLIFNAHIKNLLLKKRG